MFTGLIESTGQVLHFIPKKEQAEITISIPFASELSLGQSVAINGCCLTVTHVNETSASFDVLNQTLQVTNLSDLREGSLVNLERAMLANGRFGGHIVQGHIDTVGTILDFSPYGEDHRLEIALPASIHALCVPKGSLCIDGISLTIAELRDTSAVFWIIPHTVEITNLKEAICGKKINLEADCIAKHVAALLKKMAPLSQ